MTTRRTTAAIVLTVAALTALACGQNETTTTMAAPTVSGISVQEMDDTGCGKWLELGTVEELQQVVRANPNFDWSLTRDFDGNGYPCEYELGTGYLPHTTTTPTTTAAAPITTRPVATTTAPDATTTTLLPHILAGMYEVGIDIQPGRHRFYPASGLCYWARLSGFSGELDDIITNDNPRGRFIVEIRPSDEGFQLSC